MNTTLLSSHSEIRVQGLRAIGMSNFMFVSARYDYDSDRIDSGRMEIRSYLVISLAIRDYELTL